MLASNVILAIVRRLDFIAALLRSLLAAAGEKGDGQDLFRAMRAWASFARGGAATLRSAPDDANVKQITCALRRLRYCSAQPVVGCRGLQQ